MRGILDSCRYLVAEAYQGLFIDFESASMTKNLKTVNQDQLKTINPVSCDLDSTKAQFQSVPERLIARTYVKANQTFEDSIASTLQYINDQGYHLNGFIEARPINDFCVQSVNELILELILPIKIEKR